MDATMTTKREFLKDCLLCMGGVAVGVSGVPSLVDAAETVIGRSVVPDELWKWSKEAFFYSQRTDGLHCLKCPNSCVLGPNEVGLCRNRVSYEGKMYTIAYGNPCAVHIDPVEKKPLFHFLPSTRAFSIGTAGCNFSCLNCQNWQMSQVGPKETENYDLMPERVVEECVKNRCESIAYTYAEPVSFYEYAYDTAELAKEHKIRNIWKSNGYINEEPLRKLSKVIDASNIDLKCFDDVIYRKLCGGHLEPVLRTLKTFRQEGVWLEITNLVIPAWTDSLDMIKRMCDWLAENDLQDCPLHFSRFTPMYKLTRLPLTPVGILEKAREIALRAGVRYAYVGNVPGHWAESTYCHKCGKMIIERRGFQILSTNLVNGACGFCGERIPGVWS